MAAVTLPSSPASRAIGWELIDFGGNQQGPLGGSTQRVNRLGNRWQCTVTMPPMTAAQAREWSAKLTSGLRNGAIWYIPQPSLTIGSPGSPLVFGAGQAGNSLNIDGLVPGYTISIGQWLSISTAGVAYLYQVAATTSAGASGRASVEIEPALRTSPADNNFVFLATPLVEGLLEGPPGWQIDVDHLVHGFQFTIMEAR